MASASSYILFSQTSRPFGTRDLWGPLGLPGDTAGSVAGLINGTITDFPLSAFNAFQGNEFVRSDWALFDFTHAGQSAPNVPLTGAIDAVAVTADGRVFSGAPGPRNPEAELALDTADTITVRLADRDWNGIKNLELFLDNDALGSFTDFSVPHVSVRNVVDVRLKLADSLITEDGPPRYANVVIENVKRGEIDASELRGALVADISFASNGSGWGNTFSIEGSPFAPSVITLLPGDWAGGTTALDGFRNLVTDGSLTRVVVTGLVSGAFDARAVNAMTDVRVGPSQGFFEADWEGVGYAVAGQGDALSITVDDPAALVDLEFQFAARSGPYPIALEPFTDPATGDAFLILTLTWLAERSFDALTVEGLGGLGAPVAQSGSVYRPGNGYLYSETPPPQHPDPGVFYEVGDSWLIAGGGQDVFRYTSGDTTIWNFAKSQDALVLEGGGGRVFEMPGGTAVLFGQLIYDETDGFSYAEQGDGIRLFGARDLVVGSDIIFA